MEKIEEWKDVIGYEGLYQVSNMGRVKSLNYKHTGKERILKQYMISRYCQVSLYDEGKIKNHKVHRLVAQAFLDNPNNLPCVNHKDENKQNNCISNLEFCTIAFNNTYGTRLERYSKPIVQIHKSGLIIGVYDSARQASNELGIDNSSITKCLKGKYKTCNGYKWKYLQDFLIELKKAS